VNRETRAWNAKDVDLLVTLFHPDMVWPWPPNSDAHDPLKWMLGRWRLSVVDVDTLWSDGEDFHWKAPACKVCSRVGEEWKTTMHTGLLEY
jgi:hypothetical protein